MTAHITSNDLGNKLMMRDDFLLDTGFGDIGIRSVFTLGSRQLDRT